MAGEGLGVVMYDLSPGVEVEFNRWYKSDYMPRLLSMPGILGARTFRALQGRPAYLTLVELENAEEVVFRRVSMLNPDDDPELRQMQGNLLNQVRGVYQRLFAAPEPEPADVARARALLFTFRDVGEEHLEELEEWLRTEHFPNLSQAPGVLRVQRFKLVSALTENAPAYVNAYDLEGPEAQATEEWKRLANTPWTARMWRFMTDRMRNLYEII